MKRGKDGRVYFDGTVRDITERKRAVEQIRELSLTDELTGLHNRRGFMTLAAQQVRIADRLKQGLVLVYADIDRMKWINDTLGHKEGDTALRATAEVLRKTFRASDIIGRIGGDEFVALAIETMEMTGDVIRFRLQENLRAYNAEEKRAYDLSLSMGVAWYDPEHPRTLDELLEHGDREMYEEKQKRRMERKA
jgi:diguanylate cyclase (GGDEF)-like protein